MVHDVIVLQTTAPISPGLRFLSYNDSIKNEVDFDTWTLLVQGGIYLPEARYRGIFKLIFATKG